MPDITEVCADHEHEMPSFTPSTPVEIDAATFPLPAITAEEMVQLTDDVVSFSQSFTPLRNYLMYSLRKP